MHKCTNCRRELLLNQTLVERGSSVNRNYYRGKKCKAYTRQIIVYEESENKEWGKALEIKVEEDFQ